MEHMDEVYEKLKQKKVEYQSLRGDYNILFEKIKDNVQQKKVLRAEIGALQKEYKDLKSLKIKSAVE